MSRRRHRNRKHKVPRVIRRLSLQEGETVLAQMVLKAQQRRANDPVTLLPGYAPQHNTARGSWATK